MLIEIAIGDAYGAGFEFCGREKIDAYNTLAAYVEHELGLEAGRYTDDTQMSIANAEVLLASSDARSDDFADAYVRCYRRDRRLGYAKGLQALLDECETGAVLRQRIRPDSKRNGAAMRAVPLGLMADKQRVMALAREQALVTHATSAGVLSSQAVALMAHGLLYENARLDALPDLVVQETGLSLRRDWQAEIECDAIQTMHAVNTALLRNRSMSGLLRDCVNFGGDVDSVAAIAMGLASLSREYVADIPHGLVDALEDGTYGRSYLRRLDEALAERFPALADRRTNVRSS
ncbi:ADP-ribosylglycohydrolase family protein [Pseudoduganella sp. HUAS MS19]